MAVNAHLLSLKVPASETCQYYCFLGDDHSHFYEATLSGTADGLTHVISSAMMAHPTSWHYDMRRSALELCCLKASPVLHCLSLYLCQSDDLCGDHQLLYCAIHPHYSDL